MNLKIMAIGTDQEFPPSKLALEGICSVINFLYCVILIESFSY